ncbi:hypothetical protein ACFYXQ_37275 [Nocardia jiangxiensis]|uniref:SnoaL-like domain-containing protein n=1 Tax=Nocardia jiangxiensis TaxID=282685 RepID=A0ABW6SDE4_9NOCA
MRDFAIELFDKWAALWSGDLALGQEILAPKLTLRYAQPGASVYDEIHDPQTFVEQIELFRSERPGLRYAAQGIPVVEIDSARSGLIARPYGARRPGPDGELNLSGTDILRFEEGEIVEVWSVSGGAQGRSFYPDAVGA